MEKTRLVKLTSSKENKATDISRFIFFTFFMLTTFLSFSQNSTEKEMFYKFKLLNSDTLPHANSEVIVYSVTRKSFIKKTTSSDGEFDIMLPYGQWIIYAAKLGVKKKIWEFWIQQYIKGKYSDSKRTLYFDWPDKIKLNIQFEPSKSTIKQTSYQKLDQVVDYLKRNKNIKIEIIGHTDNTGSSAFNLNLSKQRAKAVKDYLIKAGITPDRLQTDGKGNTDPIAPNDTEKGKAMNRRTELRILNE